MKRPFEMDSTLRQPRPADSTAHGAPVATSPGTRRTRKLVAATPAPRPVLANLSASISQPFTCVPDSDICKPPLMAARGEFEPGSHPAPPRRS